MKNIKKYLWFFVFVGLFFGCVSTNNVSEPKHIKGVDTRRIVEKTFDDDEKEIYDKIINILLIKNKVRPELIRNEDKSFSIIKHPTSTIILDDVTTTDRDLKKSYADDYAYNKVYFESKLGITYQEAYDSFVEKNVVKTDLSEFINNDKRLISSSEVDEAIGKTSGAPHYWRRLYEVSPTSCGTLAISNIGFNQAKNMAIIQVEFISDSMTGFGDYIIFTKEQEWQVERSLKFVFY